MNITPTSTIHGKLQEHGFVPLPTGVDSTQIAIRKCDVQGVACYDLLVYREVKEMGLALQDEATLLTQSLLKLQTKFFRHPNHFDSNIHSHAITFLGKKAYLLTNESGQPIHCRLLLLLISSSTSQIQAPIIPTPLLSVPVIQISNLVQFLTNVFQKNHPTPRNLETIFQPLRKSYHQLGLALILLPLFLGLSGILYGLRYSWIALPLLLVGGILGPGILMRKAYSSFHQFCLQQTITLVHQSGFTSQSPSADQPIVAVEVAPRDPTVSSQIVSCQSWSSNTTAEEFRGFIQKQEFGDCE